MESTDWPIMNALMDLMGPQTQDPQPVEIALDDNGWPTIFKDVLLDAPTDPVADSNPRVFDEDGFPKFDDEDVLPEPEPDMEPVPPRSRKRKAAVLARKRPTTSPGPGCSKWRWSAKGNEGARYVAAL